MKFLLILCLTFLITPSLSIANAKEATKEIIVTLPPLSGLVVMLMPEVQSRCLLSAGADPHHFQPTPRQVDLLGQGHLLIRASRDDQGWPIRTQNSQVIDLWESKNHGWLQFEQVRLVLPQLAKALTNQYPHAQKSIQEHLITALQHVDNLEASWDKALANIKSRGVFMQHPSWHDLLESKGVPIWAVLESHQHGYEYGPRHLETALNTLNQHPDALFLGSKRNSNQSLEWLKEHQSNNHSILKLDALGSCNQPWNLLMQSNLQLLSQP